MGAQVCVSAQPAGAIAGTLGSLAVSTEVIKQCADWDSDWFYGGSCRSSRYVKKIRRAVSTEAVAFGAVAGGLLGLIIGAALPADHWVAISPGRLGLHVGPQRDGGYSLRASVRF